MTKIYAPNTEFTGDRVGVTFKAGVGETDDQAAIAYFVHAGYGIGDPLAGPAAAVADARDYSQPILLGTPLRDAAVDPRARDFLPPTNAGEADPHGPLVVAPGLHAVPPTPIAPGDVHVSEPAVQEAIQTSLAEEVLVEGQPATVATDAVAIDRPSDSDTKPLWVAYAVGQGLSQDEAEAATKRDLIDRFG